MKATINGNGPKQAEMTLEQGFWYWATSRSGTTMLCVCTSLGNGEYVLVGAEDGNPFDEPCSSLWEMLRSAKESGWTITPAKVTINAE